ncbi:MAG TPA: hypothetical protein VGR32_05940 [Brevundimonas sp.]|jgi:hypothetical protein|uniref:hypothetical protein n=1 Tax=Brevundimonas sp. TaxID=1871086 RepID=UPI002DF59C6F|nr:hypothetical protein [Brevundimonas sp.]
MPRPRSARAPREATEDRAELARAHHLWWTKWRRHVWLKACVREMWRRVCQAAPDGPWVADPDLTARISRRFIAEGAVPPPGLREAMYPPGEAAPPA